MSPLLAPAAAAATAPRLGRCRGAVACAAARSIGAELGRGVAAGPTETLADPVRSRHDVLAERLHAMIAHVLRGARDADGGNGASGDVTDGRRDAADLILVLLEVEGVAGLHVAAHPRQPFLLRDLHAPPRAVLGSLGALRAEELQPRVLVEIEAQRLAEAGGGHRLQLADPRADVDAAFARDLVEVQHAAAVENAEVHRVLG